MNWIEIARIWKIICENMDVDEDKVNRNLQGIVETISNNKNTSGDI